MALALVWCVLLLATPAGTSARPLQEMQTEIEQASARMAASSGDVDALLGVRLDLDRLITQLKSEVRERQDRELRANANLQTLGVKPSGGIEEPLAIQTERSRLDRVLVAATADLRQAQLALAGAEEAWGRVNDQRRDIFFHRIFVRWTSPVSLAFWRELWGSALPRFGDTLGIVAADWRAHVDRPNGLINVAILVALALALIGAIIALPVAARRFVSRLERQGGKDVNAEIVRNAMIGLIASVLPPPLAMLAFDAANVGLDASPTIVDPLLQKMAIATACVLLAHRVLVILFAPGDPRHRIITARDQTAARIVFSGTGLASIYAGGIVLTELADLAHSMVVLTILTTSACVLAAAGILIVGLIGLTDRDGAEQSVGYKSLPLAWTRPVLWVFALVLIALVLLGYAPLAGFLVGRFIVTSIVIALAILLIILIDLVFADFLAADRPRPLALARMVGLSPETITVLATVISGALRLFVIAFAAFVAFGRWHLEYGEANPFEDAFFGLSLGDIRVALGTVGFALLAFVIGIAATRLLVGWLDSQLLPRTRIDPGVRNSTTTIMGYGGLVLTIGFTLSVLGVNPQNLTVVAGALSVGIGFGLQAIVSNFVSGLILLAERPVRVGDTVLVKGDEGTIKKISVRSTVIAGFDRSDIIVPNSDLISSVVRNRTFGDRTRQLKFSLILDHAADPVEAAEICLGCIYHHDNVLKTPMPKVVMTKISEIGIELEVKGVIDDLANLETAMSGLMFQILANFKAKGIKLAKSGG